jgi:hypothetical protein
MTTINAVKKAIIVQMLINKKSTAHYTMGQCKSREEGPVDLVSFHTAKEAMREIVNTCKGQSHCLYCDERLPVWDPMEVHISRCGKFAWQWKHSRALTRQRKHRDVQKQLQQVPALRSRALRLEHTVRELSEQVNRQKDLLWGQAHDIPTENMALGIARLQKNNYRYFPDFAKKAAQLVDDGAGYRNCPWCNGTFRVRVFDSDLREHASNCSKLIEIWRDRREQPDYQLLYQCAMEKLQRTYAINEASAPPAEPAQTMMSDQEGEEGSNLRRE